MPANRKVMPALQLVLPLIILQKRIIFFSFCRRNLCNVSTCSFHFEESSSDRLLYRGGRIPPHSPRQAQNTHGPEQIRRLKPSQRINQAGFMAGPFKAREELVHKSPRSFRAHRPKKPSGFRQIAHICRITGVMGRVNMPFWD